jgi:hypothetical protein
MNTIKRAFIDTALSNADLMDGEEVHIRESYSGRGMYGKTCFGIVADRDGDAIKFAISLGLILAADDDEWGEVHAMDLGDAAETDSMGRGMILYFPGYQLVD